MFSEEDSSTGIIVLMNDYGDRVEIQRHHIRHLNLINTMLADLQLEGETVEIPLNTKINGFTLKKIKVTFNL
jgi:hypothetical protein